MVKTNLIRSHMALLPISQLQLAKLLGISKNTMSSRMTGKSSFTIDEIDQLCEILHIYDPAEKRYIFLS